MTDFHFIRPLWLLAIFLLIAALYLLKRLRVSQSGWDKILPQHLAQILITTPTANKNNKAQSKPLSLLPAGIIGVLTIIALAGPTWQKLPQPVFKVNQGSVLIMDMSYSMYATDITPNRLTRARYKAIDLLNGLTEGEVGLVAYAGDAFTISPLTEDTNNIKLLLPSLSPELMPELGSNPLAALVLADKMLKNSGHIHGDIYWFTDGVDRIDISDIEQWSKAHPHNLHILGIGTRNGAPIKLPNGELLKDNSGAIVIPHLSVGYLSGLAKQGRGNYQTIRNDNHDIDSLLAESSLKKQQLNTNDNSKNNEQASNQLGDSWQEVGPYLLLIILPLLLGYFRRGNIVMLLPLALLLAPPQQAQAGLWQDVWKTSDQQAQQKFDKKAYQQAAEQFKNPLWQGSAYYKAGDYKKALTAFKKVDSAQSLYNQGNALAKLKKLDQAITAYNEALAKNPNLSDAKKNKKLLEQLKKQQKKQNQKNNKQKNDKDSKKDQGNKNKDKGKNKQQSQNKGQQQNKQNDQQKTDNKQNTDDKKSDNQKTNKQETKEQKLTPEQKAIQAKAKLAKEQHDKEMQQKYQQLLNKVTDDPYLLLRNKMQLEYQKRRGDTQSRGSDKKW